jgi:hypothetical protein
MRNERKLAAKEWSATCDSGSNSMHGLCPSTFLRLADQSSQISQHSRVIEPTEVIECK